MSEYKSLLWAQGEQANVKEPIESLKENGWRYGDVPAASNVNWVLNRLAKDSEAISTELSAFKSIASPELARLAERDERLRRFALLLRDRIKTLEEETDRHGYYLEVMCGGLKALERQLKSFHETYQPLPWPEIRRRPPRSERVEPSDIFDETDRRHS